VYLILHNFLQGYICKNIQKVTLTNEWIGFDMNSTIV